MPTLTPRQLQAASLIASGQSQRQVAKAVGVSYQTVNVWAQTPDFRQQVQTIIGDAHQGTITMLQGQRLKALEQLSNLLETAPPAVKLQAIRTVLEATNSLPTPAAPAPARSPEQASHDRLRDALIEATGWLVEEGHLPAPTYALRH
ncbi:MAG: LuxR C-terminal-related transcriptional regulator [Burkholderiaceae bacterium]|nr:LuxR C-terminal-related transcriptional regulator [Burkholderiaceae bacterium]